MKHLVFGTGLIGSYLGGCFSHQGLDLVLHGRPSSRDALGGGFGVSSLDGGKANVEPISFTSADEPGTYDVIWLTVKCTSVANCLEELKAFIQPGTIVVCCQNGFGSDAQVQAAFPNNIVISAIIGFNVVADETNQFNRSTDGALVVEPHPRLSDVIEQINCQLLPTHASSSIEADRWAKLQLNLASPVNALSNVPIKAMTEDPGYRKVIAALMKELLAVTKALNIQLPKLTAVPATWLPHIMTLPNWLYLKIAQKTLAIDPTARTSMWWDLSQGKLTEIDYFNQAVALEETIWGLTVQ